MPKSVFTEAYQSFVGVLVGARKKAGVTQAELARRLGKPQPFVSLVERGVRRVDVVEFCAIADALETDATELFREVRKAFPRNVKIS